MGVRHVEQRHVGRADVRVAGGGGGDSETNWPTRVNVGVTHVRGPRFGRGGAGRADRGRLSPGRTFLNRSTAGAGRGATPLLVPVSTPSGPSPGIAPSP